MRWKSGRSRGQATIELALVLPVIVVLILGMQWAGTGINNDINVTNAAQAGAQAAADTLDEIDAAMSCTAPATRECVQSAVDLITGVVDAALPCSPPAHADNDAACSATVHLLGGKVAGWGLAFCFAVGPGCAPALGAMGPMLNAAYNCGAGHASCVGSAETLADAVMEAGLGCDGRTTDCPPPLSCAGCSASPNCSSPCSRAVMLEIVGGFAQLGLSCAAVRRALQLDTSVTDCDPTDPDVTARDPWITTVTVAGGMPFLPTNDDCFGKCAPNHPCIGGDPDSAHRLLETLCRSGGTLVEQVEVHYQPSGTSAPIVASAYSVPVAQFTAG